MEERLLIVEDSDDELRRYVNYCRRLRWGASGVSSAGEAFDLLKKRDFSVALIDLFLSREEDAEGLKIVQYIIQHFPRMIVLVMSHTGDVNLFRKALKLGAHHIIKKPVVEPGEFELGVMLAKKSGRVSGENRILKRFHSSSSELKFEDEIIGERDAMKLASIVAVNSDIPCVIHGETGTGKEKMARRIWELRSSEEKNIPFVPVNCSLLNSDLAASLLFGHVRGAFSGADRETVGYVGQANGGFLFLDEIHCLSLQCQEKLLRVLNDGCYQKVGDSIDHRSRFQPIVATTRQLDDEVDRGRFLLDLRARLTGIDIELKPLRERLDEMEAFVRLFFRRWSIELPDQAMRAIVERCQDFYWQGNIRQLYQVLRSMVAICQADGLGPDASKIPVIKTMFAPSRKA